MRIPARRFRRTRVTHDASQSRLRPTRRRHLLPHQAAVLGHLNVVLVDRRGRSRQEGRPPSVKHPVEHDAQRVDVHVSRISPSKIDLRRHVGSRALAGHRLSRLALQPTRDAEISQLVATLGLAPEDVVWLHVAVNDATFMACLQCPAQIDAQACHLFRLRLTDTTKVGNQRLKQLHANPNGITVAFGQLNESVVLDVHNVVYVTKRIHRLDLGQDFRRPPLQHEVNRFFAHAHVAKSGNLIRVTRDLNNLHRARGRTPYCPVCSRTKSLVSVPFRPNVLDTYHATRLNHDRP